MTVADELATLLAANSVGVVGDSIFVNFTPTTSTGVALSIFETPGSSPVTVHGTGKPVFERPRVQIVVRSTKPAGNGPAHPATAKTRIQTAWNVLSQQVNTVLSGTTTLRVEPLQSPFFLDRDEHNRVRFACNFEVWRVST